MDINRIVAFMLEHSINSRQIMYMWSLTRDSLYEKTIKEKNKSKRIFSFGKEGLVGTLIKTDPLSYEELLDLEKKGFIININVDQKNMFFDSIILTPLFYEEFFISKELFEELWETYPVTININGANLPARSGDYDVLRERYMKIIGKDRDFHTKIIEIVSEAKERGIITIGLEKFIVSRHWETFSEMLSEGENIGGKVI